MKIEKKVLTETLRVLGKVVSQTSPEAVLRQKQKEREFIQAKRAIERIKMAI